MGIATLRCGNTPLVRGHKTWIMGILNVTPDSFSDGGDFYDTQAAIAHGLELAANGADIIDVGGVSTAPNAKSVSAEQEHQRVIPVIKGLNGKGITAISIDTTRADVALAALEAGASWINDQSAGLFDPDMPSAMAKADGVVIMHNGGGVASGVLAGESVFYADIIDTLRKFFHRRL
ncbi:MAG TPA: dihydropteroate synthase, partial [Myxococcota bacterium]|nr:dihydropteroate synthase [Myxococcota bacterium]